MFGNREDIREERHMKTDGTAGPNDLRQATDLPYDITSIKHLLQSGGHQLGK